MSKIYVEGFSDCSLYEVGASYVVKQCKQVRSSKNAAPPEDAEALSSKSSHALPSSASIQSRLGGNNATLPRTAAGKELRQETGQSTRRTTFLTDTAGHGLRARQSNDVASQKEAKVRHLHVSEE